MNSSTHPDALKALQKAFEAVESAAYDLQGGFILTAVNRAYYACYYCMAGLLYNVEEASSPLIHIQ